MPMFESQEAGEPCLHPTLEHIGRAIGFPDPEDHWIPSKRVRDPAGENVVPYLMTSRDEYIQWTMCMVSPSTYDHYRVAFLEHVLNWIDGHDAAARMRTFLRAAGEGKHTGDGFLESVCMTPTMVRIADELELLDENGRFTVGDHRQHLVSGDFNDDGYLDNAYASVYGDDD